VKLKLAHDEPEEDGWRSFIKAVGKAQGGFFDLIGE
jgi:hypothetical protein